MPRYRTQSYYSTVPYYSNYLNANWNRYYRYIPTAFGTSYYASKPYWYRRRRRSHYQYKRGSAVRSALRPWIL